MVSEDPRDLFDNAPCGYLSLSPNDRVVAINRTLCGWLGRSVESLINRPIRDVLTAEAHEAFSTHLRRRARIYGRADEVTLDLRDVRGRAIPVLGSLAEKRSASGKHLFTRLTVFKAAKRMAYETGLLEARRNAEAKIRAEQETARMRDQFIAVLAHDLRNPLNAVLAGTDLLKQGRAMAARERAIIAGMESTVTRAATLIEDVLDFARGRLGDGMRLTLNRDRSLSDLLRQVVEEIQVAHSDREIITNLGIIHPIVCDAERIAQLASNLIANAVAHGAGDGAVVVDARTSSKYFVLTVTNDGGPIPDEVRQRLFQPFVRGGASNGRDRRGLGLGLYIVNEIARAHGGKMAVSCSEGTTSFTFTMPRLGTPS